MALVDGEPHESSRLITSTQSRARRDLTCFCHGCGGETDAFVSPIAASCHEGLRPSEGMGDDSFDNYNDNDDYEVE